MIGSSIKACGLMSVIAVGALSAQAAHAQVDAQRYGSDRTVRCDSNDNRLRHCDADTRGGVRLLRQVSKSSCVEGRSWGYDRSGIWVNNGCRAEFALGRGNGWGGGGGGGGDGRTVRCDSNDNRYQQCAIDGRSATLVRQLSKSACVEGRSWGTGRGYVWVNNGCRAEFAVRNGGGGNGGGWSGGNGGGHGGGWNNPGVPAQTLYCGSDDNRQRRCNVTIRRDARMVRQASKAACIEGQSWGWDRNGIWVSNGCRGDFQVQ